MVKASAQDGDVRVPFQSIEQFVSRESLGSSNLDAKAVHLWGIDLDGGPCCLKRCAQWLDEEEQRRAARLVREPDRQRYVFAHGALRVILSRYLRIRPDDVEFSRNEAGKPFVPRELQDEPTITFNMSHAHGRALIATSMGQEVGVDLERIRADVEVVTLSKRYFAPSEHATIVQSAQQERAKTFFRYWVAKEAVLKAQGIGLRALSQCEILMGAGGAGAEVLVPAGSLLEHNWAVRILSCDEGWEAAVAARGVDWRIVV